MAQYKSVLDVLEHSNRRPHTSNELVSLLEGTKNQSSVSCEIKHLIKMEQIIRVEIKIPCCTKVVLYMLNKKNLI